MRVEKALTIVKAYRPPGYEPSIPTVPVATPLPEVANDVRPDLVRRTRGGWLAVAPSGARFKIGVTAPTEEGAREKFRATYNRWAENCIA